MKSVHHKDGNPDNNAIGNLDVQQTQHTPEPFTDSEARQIRSMSPYWKEVRGREDQSPLVHEAREVLVMLTGSKLLRMAEFSVDPVRIAAPELLEACEELLGYVEDERGWTGEEDAEPMVMRGRAALAKAKGTP